MFLLKDIGQLTHQFVALSVLAPLGQVVVSKQLVKDTLVSTFIGALSLVCRAIPAVKMVVADSMSVVDILHIVLRLNIVFEIFLAFIQH